ncbi:Sec-independent protein translocase subunit TatA [Streptacidiphilus sp. P02-A3a]|uniref:Sec-independent protein translocase subunit TatA n=1 Tax=Streptacidiphilus sp. P02-A3a TaxID=2704468 RepID=UPI0015F87851|nr:Sec-independent protein translocase subunit TatA [Streptacidiphilus sp. P02-A3a]QMU69379.1 Sec-independent protein translocase subunit TatA [Streptacidiphilus sp. P02-A3a]
MFENRALEILIVALVVLLLFGAKRLPDAARSLGKSLRILKAETHALRSETDGAAPEPATDREPAPLTASADPARATGGGSEEPATTATAAPH